MRPPVGFQDAEKRFRGHFESSTKLKHGAQIRRRFPHGLIQGHSHETDYFTSH